MAVCVVGSVLVTDAATTTTRVARTAFVTPDETAPRWWPGYPTSRGIVTEGSGPGVVVTAAADEPGVVAFAALPAVHRRRPSSREVAECRGGDEDEEAWGLCGSLQLLSGGGAVFEGQAAMKAVGTGGDGGGDDEGTMWAVYMVATDARGNMQQLPTRLLASSDEAPHVVARRRSRASSELAAVLIEPWEAEAEAGGERRGVGLDTRARCRHDAAGTDLTPNATA